MFVYKKITWICFIGKKKFKLFASFENISFVGCTLLYVFKFEDEVAKRRVEDQMPLIKKYIYFIVFGNYI